MTQKELPLYPKLSSIYNKIMQLALAIAFIIVLMNLWLSNQKADQQTIEEHFFAIGQQHIQQVSAAITVFIDQDKLLLQNYLDQLSATEDIKEVHVYDLSGQLIAASTEQSSIKDLYGINAQKLNRSATYVPFIGEIRQKDLQGYVRLTLNQPFLTESLLNNSQEQSRLQRLMLIIAVLVGFLLTRGLNRFSRQGFRLANRQQAQK